MTENQGKGAALQTGFRMAIGEIVIVQDADLEYNPEDILRVIEPIAQGQSAIALVHAISKPITKTARWSIVLGIGP